jgi:hypothetical protein
MENSLFRNVTRGLGLMSVTGLVYIMFAITFWWDDVFVDLQTISLAEYGILIGFTFVVLFLLVSLIQHTYSVMTSDWNRVD